MCTGTNVAAIEPERHDGLEYYHVTFFDGQRARRDRRIWLVQADAIDATREEGPIANTQERLMLNAINAMRLAPQDMQWRFFNFRRIPLPVPPVAHVTN